jgi:DNA (cytosine-5)-methyltransferase 1
MKYGSICSGIEAATVAWHPLGWTPAWFSEIAPFPSAVLNHYYPTVPNLGDMTKLTKLITNGEVDAPDIICGGTPCQAFSTSGNRQSLNDDRGNLSLVFCEVANAVDNVRRIRKQQPSIILWENVRGVFSTNDNAFGCLLAGLAGESNPLNAPNGKWPIVGIVVGPQRNVAWRVLDAQYFGLAQRRKRVFVVASARTDIDIGQILIEFDGVQRTTKPRRETRQNDSGTVAISVDAYSSNPTLARELSHTLKTTTNEAVFIGNEDISPTLRANAKQSLMSGDANINAPLAISIQRNIINRYHGGAQGVGISTEDISYTLTTADRHAVAFQSPVVIRRLTPRECERLQGFPDDYTLIPYQGKPASDSVRYHAIGNSWAVPVVRWIGKRIEQIIMNCGA